MSRYYRLALVTVGTLLLTLFASPLTYAETGTDLGSSGSGDTSTADDTEQEDSTPALRQAAAQKHAGEVKTKVEEYKAKAHERRDQSKDATAKRLEADKLRVCQQHETSINKLMVRIGDRGQKQLDLISKIADRVQAYKTDKDLTVADYDTLLSTVGTQKTAAQSAVDAAKAVQVSFKCDGSDPHGAASSFLDAMKTQNKALKDYRNSVIDLLKAVKKSQGSSKTGKSGDSSDATPSPAPAPAPAPSPSTDSSDKESNT